MPASEADNDDPANPQVAATTTSTPRRSSAVRRPRKNAGTASKKPAANKSAANKTAANKAPPTARNNGKFRGKAAAGGGGAGSKKPEPTLLGDFLLGRPSADRVRRRNSSVQQLEMKVSAVSKLQPPGGVKARVKQWQKTSATANIVDPAAPEKTQDSDVKNSGGTSTGTGTGTGNGDGDGDGDGNGDGNGNGNGNSNGDKSSGKKDKPVPTSEKKVKGNSSLPPKSRGMPAKRVVSDSHWVKTPRKAPPKKPDLLLNLLVDPVTVKKNQPVKKENSTRLPKNFVKSNWANPPLANKIEDWTRRTDELNAPLFNENPTEKSNVLPGSVWKSSATNARPPAKFAKPKPLPKNFVKTNWANPPLERKILDWAARTDEANAIPCQETPDVVADVLPDDVSSSSATKAKPPAKFDKKKRIPNNVVKSNPPNPPLERKIHDWVQQTDEGKTLTSSASPQEATDMLDGSVSTPSARNTTPATKPSRRRNPPKVVATEGVKSDLAIPPISNKVRGRVHRTDEDNTITSKKSPKEAKNIVDGSVSTPNARNTEPLAKFNRRKGPPKEVVKEAAKEPVKEVVKEAAKEVVKEVVKEATKEVVKEVVKEATKEVVKEAVKSEPAIPPIANKIRDWTEQTKKPSTISHDEKHKPAPEFPKPASSRPINIMKGLAAKMSKPKGLPKDFVESHWANPPLERKMQDWAERMYEPDSISYLDAENLSPPPSPSTSNNKSEVDASTLTGLLVDPVESDLPSPLRVRRIRDRPRQSDRSESLHENERSTTPRKTSRRSENAQSSPIRRSSEKIVPPYASRTPRSKSPLIQLPMPSHNDGDSNIGHMRQNDLKEKVVSKARTDSPPHNESKSSIGRRGAVYEARTRSPAHSENKPTIGRRGAVHEARTRSPAHSENKPTIGRRGAVHEARTTSPAHSEDKSVGRKGDVHEARTRSPAHSDSKPTIQRRGAVHEARTRSPAHSDSKPTVQRRGAVRPKNYETVKDQEATKPDEYGNSQLQSVVSVRRRTKEENARRQDRLANNKDPTRSRDLRTLAPLKNVQIDQTRQVKAKEYFDLDLRHSNGQRMACEIEFIVRDSVNDAGDILICEVDARRRSHCLLFQPLYTDQISVRQGDMEDDLILMVCDHHMAVEWRECFILKAEHPDIVEEFLSMFSHEPKPPAISRRDQGHPDDTIRDDNALTSGALICINALDVPIGERVEFKDSTQQTSQQIKKSHGLIDTATMAYDIKPNKSRTSYSKTTTRRQGSVRSTPETTTSTISSQLSLKEPSLGSKRLLITDKEWNNKATQPSPTDQSHIIPDLRPASQHGESTNDAPPPASHKENVSTGIKSELPMSRNFTHELVRRSSSPLKNEYQPSHDSTSYSTSYFTETSDEDSLSESSSGYEEEAEDTVPQLPQIHKATAPSQNDDVPNIIVQKPKKSYCYKFFASISCWRLPPGRWDDLESKQCSIVVTPGSIEVFPKHNRGDPSNNTRPSQQPLVALALTPVVLIRQSNGLDVEIHSPPLETSLLESTGILRFRSSNVQECRALYEAAYQARQDNETYNRLQNDRMLNDYNKQSDKEWHEHKARYSWLGRKKSYRASARGSTFSEPDESIFSLSTKFSVFKRKGNGARLGFNKSRFEGGTQSRGSSLYGTSDSAQSTSTRTQTDSSFTTTDTTSNSMFDSNKLFVRLYRAESFSDWVEIGLCHIKIGAPEPGMHPVSNLNYGVPKQVILTEFIKEKPSILNKHLPIGSSQEEDRVPLVYFNGVVGARCFSRYQRIAVVMNVFEDIIGPNGEIGMPGAKGAISGKQRKWMFKCSNTAQASLIFALLGGGV